MQEFIEHMVTPEGVRTRGVAVRTTPWSLVAAVRSVGAVVWLSIGQEEDRWAGLHAKSIQLDPASARALAARLNAVADAAEGVGPCGSTADNSAET